MFNLFDSDNTDDFEFLLEQIGSEIFVNDNMSSAKAVVTNTLLEQNYDDKRIATVSPLNRGDIIVFNGQKFIVTTEVNEKRYNKYKGIMRRLTHTIIVNSSCRFSALDCYITTSNFGVSGGQVLSTTEGELQVYTSLINLQSSVRIGNEFMIEGSKFKITGIDTFSKKGIAILTCEKTQINPATDDLEHNIANGKECKVEITNSEPIKVTVGSALQLTWTSTGNAPVTFQSSDETIAMVDATGVVSGMAEGTVVIYATNATNVYVTDDVPITVEDIPVVKTISISSDQPTQVTGDYYYMYANRTGLYTATVYSGATPTGDSVTFQIFADDKVSTVLTANMTSSVSGNVQTINSKGVYFYFQLKATLVSDPSIFVWQRIRVKSLI